MTGAEITAKIIISFGFLGLYLFVGFGPGFIIGMLLANFLVGRGKPIFMDVHEENKKRAAQHNAQWNPTHERWQR